MNSLRLTTLLFVIALVLTACKDKPPNSLQVAETTNIAESITTNPSNNSTKARKSILFYGNSLTAGYGLNEEESFPSLIQDRIDSLGLPYIVINAGLSGETTSGGKNRIDWVMREQVDIFVLELGANDMLRGLDIIETEKNLREILDVVKSKSPDARLVIAGMEAAPNMGQKYMQEFRGIFNKIARDYQATLIPFLLDGVAGIPDLNLSDGKHPNAIGQHIVKENVWRVLADLLTN